MFGFGDKRYIQKEGIPVGSRLGKNFACICMRKWNRLGSRIRRICKKEKDYVRHRQELKLQLRRRGYSGNLIVAQLQKVDKLYRNELCEVKRKDKHAKSVQLVMTFSNLLRDMHSVVRKHMNVLYRSVKNKEAYKEPPIVAFRRDRNLCDTLVHSKTNKALKPTSQTCQDGCEK